MDVQDWRIWAAFGVAVISLATTIWGHLQHRSRDNSGKIETLTERVGDLETKQAATEIRMENMPTKDGQHAIEISVKAIQGDVQTQGEVLKNTQRVTNRIDDFLRNKGNH